MDDSQQRKAIARALLAADVSDVDEDALVLAGTGLRAPAEAVAPFPFPYPDGLAPLPRPLATPPASDAPLPAADVLVVTWTAAEHKALADVFTRGHPRDRWYPYDRRFADHYAPLIRRGAPAQAAQEARQLVPREHRADDARARQVRAAPESGRDLDGRRNRDDARG